MPLFGEDLDKLLNGRGNACLPQRTPFKHFADTYYLHRSSLSAQTAISHHVHHLKGLSTHPTSLWPPQRSPDWFKGSSASFIHPNGTPSRPGERTPVTETSEMDGLLGIIRSVLIPHLNTLKSDHGISPAVVAKTALAILNTRLTGLTHAIFANYDAGRSWPFLSPWISAHLPNAMDLPGPTWQGVVNHILIDPQESVLELFNAHATSAISADASCTRPTLRYHIATRRKGWGSFRRRAKETSLQLAPRNGPGAGGQRVKKFTSPIES